MILSSDLARKSKNVTKGMRCNRETSYICVSESQGLWRQVKIKVFCTHVVGWCWVLVDETRQE